MATHDSEALKVPMICVVLGTHKDSSYHSSLCWILAKDIDLMQRSGHLHGQEEESLQASCKIRYKEKEKNHCIFSSQLRADQMPGPPREGQLMCTLFLSTRQQTEQHQ